MGLEKLFAKALALHENGQTAQAKALYLRLLCHAPSSPGVLGLTGAALTQEGAHTRAIPFLQRTLAIDPSHAATYSNLGNAFKGLKQLEKALIAQKIGLALDPALFDGLRNLAMTFEGLKRHSEALALIQFAQRLRPDRPEALSFKGVVLVTLGCVDEATNAQKSAVALQPNGPEAYNNLCVAFLKGKKTRAAITMIERSLRIEPKNTESWLNLGSALSQSDQNAQALTAFDRAITLDPRVARAYMGRAINLRAQQRQQNVAIYHERAHQIDSAMAGALGHALYYRSKSLEWTAVQILIRRIKQEIIDCKSIDNPFPLLTRIDDPLIHKLTARSHARKAFPKREDYQARIWHRQCSDKIRIGYFSSDLHPLHPVFKNIYPLLKQHDRSRFELLCFDYSNAGEIAIGELFDEVVPIHSMADNEVAALSRQKKVDIAIDLNGYTEDARTDIFANRAAFLQINYLGYPGTMGSTYHDFIIADDYVIPRDQQHLYTETILRLPCFFMPYDLRANRIGSLPQVQREDYGLPGEGFIYCSFNDFHKITEATFQAWISILQQTKHTVLWLATRGDIGIDVLKEQVKLAGIDPGRLIEAHRVESSEEHHARLALADLMLDTFPYNSHTTACDAISVGLPLLTYTGTSFASRVSGSLLSKAGVTGLITSSLQEYVERAITLADDPQLYRAVRLAVANAPDRMPTPNDYAKNIESLFEQLLHHSR